MENRDAPDVFVRAAIHVSELLAQIIASRDQCSVVVSGGSAIQRTLEHLALCDVPWSSVHLYMADERCLPKEDKRRNEAMITEVFIRPTQIKPENFFRIPAELGPIPGAQAYEKSLLDIDSFDIALLGVGPDGHIASLFPNHPSIESNKRVVAVTHSPKFPPDRISVGLTMLRGATHRFAVLSGSEKGDLITRLKQGSKPPVALFEPTGWFLDSELSELGFP